MGSVRPSPPHFKPRPTPAGEPLQNPRPRGRDWNPEDPAGWLDFRGFLAKFDTVHQGVKTYGAEEGFECPAVARWSYRERLARAGGVRGDFCRRNAARLGFELTRDRVNDWKDSGVVPALERAARKIGGWVASGLEKLRRAVHAAWSSCCPDFDALHFAMSDADRDAHAFGGFEKNPRRARLLALAYHLKLVNKYGWCPLGSARVAKWLGVHRNTVDADVRALEDAGLLAVRREGGRVVWSYKAGDAREVRYTGPQPEKLNGEEAEGREGQQAAAGGEVQVPGLRRGGDDPAVRILQGEFAEVYRVRRADGVRRLVGPHALK